MLCIRVIWLSLALLLTVCLPVAAGQVQWVSQGGNTDSCWPDLLQNMVVFDSLYGPPGAFSNLYQGLAGATTWDPLAVGLLGQAANESSFWPAVALTGRVAFMSYASNLVEGDTNGCADIFVRDPDGTITRVSVPDPQMQGETQANADCFYPAISPLGRYVTWCSRASNLALFPPGGEQDFDRNGNFDVFCRDLESGRTYIISPRDGGRWDVVPYRSSVSNSWIENDQGQVVAQDPPVVVFEWAYRTVTEFEGQSIYTWNLGAPAPTRLSATDQRWCYNPDICISRRHRRSSDPIESFAIYECDGNLTLCDLKAQTSERLEWDQAYSYHDPHLSHVIYDEAPPARYITYQREDRTAPGLPEVWVYDRVTTLRYCLSHDATEAPVPFAYLPVIDYTGRWAAFYSTADNLLVAEDTNGVGDVFLTANELYPPHVTGISPSGDPYTRPDTPIVVSFNEPMDPTSLPPNIALIGPSGFVPGSFNYDTATYTYTFMPSDLLEPGPYFIFVTGRDDALTLPLPGVCDAYQVPMDKSVSTYFYVPDTLTLLSMQPVDRATQVARDVQVRARFNQAIDMVSVTADTFRLVGAHYGPIPASFSYESSSNTVVLVPNAPLRGDVYSVYVQGGPSGIVGTSTRPLDRDYTWSFTVADSEPPLVWFNIAEGQTVSGVTTVEALADEVFGLGRGVLYLDGRQVASFSGPPYRYVWNTYPFAVTDGLHQARAEIWDLAGWMGEGSVNFFVDNTTFDDVPRTAAIWRYVEAVAREGITAGCSRVPPLFCPGSAVTRGQFAVFLCRAIGQAPYYPPTPTFTDVPASHPQFGYVEALYRLGLAAGCSNNPSLFCPSRALTRAAMAVFLCRAAGIAPYYNPVPTFADVSPTSVAYPYVEAIFRQGITGGCAIAPLRFCPSSSCTRGEMAVFLCRAFMIPLPTL